MPSRTIIRTPQDLSDLMAAIGVKPGEPAIAEVADGELRLRRATATERLDAEVATGKMRRFESTEELDRWLLADVETDGR